MTGEEEMEERLRMQARAMLRRLLDDERPEDDIAAAAMGAVANRYLKAALGPQRESMVPMGAVLFEVAAIVAAMDVADQAEMLMLAERLIRIKKFVLFGCHQFDQMYDGPIAQAAQTLADLDVKVFQA